MRHLHALPLVPLFLSLFACVAWGDQSPAPSSGEAGIEGVITISPTHGGPIKQGEPESKPLPDSPFEVRQGEQIVTSFTTDAEGRFRVLLPPGKYTVARANQKHTFGAPFQVEVTAAKMTQVQWDCESGLR